jgi:ubiquinone/menaquinone biosynthesis C-methylase UbiE
MMAPDLNTTMDQDMSTAKVVQYYSAFDEWARLDTPAGALEFERTLAVLTPHLQPRSRILDLGGGPGRYTIALAQAGNRVCLADLSPRLLEIARQKVAEHGAQNQVEAIVCANAVDLSAFATNSFDAVLALGPFYHLTAAADRASAAREIHRVLKADALAAIAFLPRLCGIAGLIGRAAANPDQVPVASLDEAFATGIFHNGAATGFQEGYYADPDEIRRLFATVGFDQLDLYSLRGLAAGQEELLLRIRQTNPALSARFMAILASTAQDPATIALGGHALLLARKAAN